MTRLSIIVIVFSVLAACRFNKPILSIPHSKYLAVDSITHITIKKNYFKYISLRRKISLGGCYETKRYNKDGKLINKTIFKETQFGVRDGRNRYYLKEITYDSIGFFNKKIYYQIHQNHGTGGRIVYEKTVYRPMR